MHTWSEMLACVPPSGLGSTKKSTRCPPLRCIRAPHADAINNQTSWPSHDIHVAVLDGRILRILTAYCTPKRRLCICHIYIVYCIAALCCAVRLHSPAPQLPGPARPQIARCSTLRGRSGGSPGKPGARSTRERLRSSSRLYGISAGGLKRPGC
jgi:hypothetical protein